MPLLIITFETQKKKKEGTHLPNIFGRSSQTIYDAQGQRKQIELAIIGKNEIVGEFALVQGRETHRSTVITISNVLLYVLPKKDFESNILNPNSAPARHALALLQEV